MSPIIVKVKVTSFYRLTLTSHIQPTFFRFTACAAFILHTSFKNLQKKYVSVCWFRMARCRFSTARFIVAANPVNRDATWFLQIIAAPPLWRLGAKPGTAAGSWQANALHRFFCCLTPPAESKKLTASPNPHDSLLLTCWASRADEACTKPAYHYWRKEKKKKKPHLPPHHCRFTKHPGRGADPQQACGRLWPRQGHTLLPPLLLLLHQNTWKSSSLSAFFSPTIVKTSLIPTLHNGPRF